MAEKAILAYFRSPEEAQSCVPKLRALRAADVQIDAIDEYSGLGNREIRNPISSGDFPGLSYLTLSADAGNPDASVMMAADVDASGMADGGWEILSRDADDMTRRNILLTVVVDEGTYDQALRVLNEAGGRV